MSQSEILLNSSSKNMLIGLLLGLAAYTVIPLGDGIAKVLTTEGYTSVQITWGRYFFHFLFLLPIVLHRFGKAGLKPKGLKIQTFRAYLIIIATFSFFTSLKTVPLADALSLAFVAPLVVTGLSVIILKEQVGWHRWFAVLIGFVGAIIIIKPGSGLFQWPALYALGAGALFGVYITVTRKTSGQNPPLVSLFYMGFLGTVSLTIVVGFSWVQPDLKGWLLMATVGACAATGHGLIITATDYMEAGLLAPLQYFELLIGAVFGFIIFGEVPDQYTWAGSAIVIASGLYIAYRERLRIKQSANH